MIRTQMRATMSKGRRAIAIDTMDVHYNVCSILAALINGCNGDNMTEPQTADMGKFQ